MRAELLQLVPDIFFNVLEGIEKRRRDSRSPCAILNSFPQILFGGEHQSAIGVIDDHELSSVEQVVRHDQRTQSIFGNDSAGVANDVRVAGFQAERTDGKPRVHASEHGKVALGARRKPSQFVRTGVEFVCLENFVDYAHDLDSVSKRAKSKMERWLGKLESTARFTSEPSFPLKPQTQMAHPYICTCKKGPGTQVLTMRRFLIAVVSLAALPAIAFAQRGGMGAGMARPAMAAPAPHAAMRAGPTGSASHASSASHSYAGYPHFVRTRSGGIVARTSPRPGTPVHRTGPVGSGHSLRSQDIVPGLGFDYAHLAATHPNGIHDRDRNRRFNDGFFPLFFGGGFGFPLFPDDVEDAPATDAQQVDTAQSEPPQPARRPGDYDTRQNRPLAASPSQDVAEQPAEPYVFVRRDGTVFFATAYAWENGTLRYITAEGLRRTVTSDKLDLNATQQFNEQRGLTFRFPA